MSKTSTLREDIIRLIFDVDTNPLDRVDDALKTTGKMAAKLGKMTFKGLMVGLTAASTGVAALTKNAVEAYANTEQLIGGVETLFGAGGRSLEKYAEDMGRSVDDVREDYDMLISAQNTMLANANNAFKTAGLSANEYMENATSFAASLVSSLAGDTKKAAEYADTAMVDMADNVNKMGSDAASIQNAYQGFAKQNYTMLDNLKLGRTCQIAEYKPRENGETLAMCA